MTGQERLYPAVWRGSEPAVLRLQRTPLGTWCAELVTDGRAWRWWRQYWAGQAVGEGRWRADLDARPFGAATPAELLADIEADGSVRLIDDATVIDHPPVEGPVASPRPPSTPPPVAPLTEREREQIPDDPSCRVLAQARELVGRSGTIRREHVDAAQIGTDDRLDVWNRR